MRKNSEQGSAIITVIVILTITLFFISLLILYNNYKRKLTIAYGKNIQTHYSIESAVNLSLGKYEKQLNNENYHPATYSYHLFEKDSVTVIIEPWGFFLLCTSSVIKKKNIITRRYILSQKPANRFNAALVLGDLRSPLVVAGNTRITGDIYLGPKGIKAGSLRGSRYHGNKLVYGEIHATTTSHFPLIKSDLFSYQLGILKRKEYQNISSTAINDTILELNSRDVLITDAEISRLLQMGIKEIRGPGILYTPENIRISNLRLSGPITILSGNMLFFEYSSKLNNVLAIAKKIKLDNNLKAQGQFIATDDIEIGYGVKLSYPSFVYLLADQNWEVNKNLLLKNNVTINGGVIISNQLKNKLNTQQYRLSIENDAEINGFVYSGSYIDLKGRINGTVFTYSFYLYHSPTIYVNWLYNALIDRNRIIGNYAVPLCFDIKTNLIILQEL